MSLPNVDSLASYGTSTVWPARSGIRAPEALWNRPSPGNTTRTARLGSIVAPAWMCSARRYGSAASGNTRRTPGCTGRICARWRMRPATASGDQARRSTHSNARSKPSRRCPLSSPSGGEPLPPQQHAEVGRLLQLDEEETGIDRMRKPGGHEHRVARAQRDVVGGAQQSRPVLLGGPGPQQFLGYVPLEAETHMAWPYLRRAQDHPGFGLCDRGEHPCQCPLGHAGLRVDYARSRLQPHARAVGAVAHGRTRLERVGCHPNRLRPRGAAVPTLSPVVPTDDIVCQRPDVHPQLLRYGRGCCSMVISS